MKNEILFNLTYGMYAIGVNDGKKASACIANTVVQVCNAPNMVAVSINHNNYSNECIVKNGIFTVSVLSEDTSEKSKGTPMTYGYYHSVIKGKAPKNAPTYQQETQKDDNPDTESWICTVCGYVYNDPYISFEDLPDDWVCPICGAPKSAFKRK